MFGNKIEIQLSCPQGKSFTFKRGLVVSEGEDGPIFIVNAFFFTDDEGLDEKGRSIFKELQNLTDQICICKINALEPIQTRIASVIKIAQWRNEQYLFELSLARL